MVHLTVKIVLGKAGVWAENDNKAKHEGKQLRPFL